MNRKEITRFLTDLLIQDRLFDRKYYAKEVTLDYGTTHPKRIDVMEFRPEGVMYTSDIEKGIFVCYEIKSCVEDVYSGNGLNFYTEENYIVTTMQTYKKLQEDIRNGKLEEHIKACVNKETCPRFGIMIAVPYYLDLRKSQEMYEEYDHPHELTPGSGWKLWTVMPCRKNRRERSMNELLFCMLRAKHNDTNKKLS